MSQSIPNAPKGAEHLSLLDYRHWSSNTIEVGGSIDLGPWVGGGFFLAPVRLVLRGDTAVADLDRHIATLTKVRDAIAAGIKALGPPIGSPAAAQAPKPKHVPLEELDEEEPEDEPKKDYQPARKPGKPLKRKSL